MVPALIPDRPESHTKEVAVEAESSAERHVACIGCGGRVPDIDGPVHRYMDSSPGCWHAYTELMANRLPPGPHAPLTVDAYAVTHPGVPGPHSTASVWVHLITMSLVLENGWKSDQAVRIRRIAADAFSDWPRLSVPADMGAVTAADVAGAVADASEGLSASAHSPV